MGFFLLCFFVKALVSSCVLDLKPEGPIKSLCPDDESVPEHLRKVGMLLPDEILIKVSDQSYIRGGAECYIAPVRVKVWNGSSIITRIAMSKAWLNSHSGVQMQNKRDLLESLGMPVLPQYGHVYSKRDPEQICETYQYHADPMAFNSGKPVMEAVDNVKYLNQEEVQAIGRMAAILDDNRFSVTRILSDVLLSDRGPVYNDFGYDLGEQGPKTETYYGCEEPVEYFSAIRSLVRELKQVKREESILDAAIESYALHRKISVEEVQAKIS